MGFEEALATAVLGIDTLWGGDVMQASGTGRFIADSWFSDAPLPRAYTDAAAAAVRASGGVSAKQPDLAAIDAYLAAVPVKDAIDGVAAQAAHVSGLRGGYLAGLAECFGVMWDLALEVVSRGAPVPYDRCLRAGTGAPPAPSTPQPK